MRHYLRDLGLSQPIVHANRDVADELPDLTVGDERADRDQTAVARREIGAEPQVAEQDISRVLHDARKQVRQTDPRRASRGQPQRPR